MSKEARLAKNTAVLAIGNICTKGISFLLLPLYTSILSTEEYGIVDMVTTYSGFMAILLTLQLEQGLFRFLVEARGNAALQRAYTRMVLVTVTVVLAVYVAAGACVLNRLGYEYTAFLLANTVVCVLNAIILQIPRGLGDTVAYTIGSFLSGASTVILNVLFVAILRMGVEGMLAAGILGSAICICYVFGKTKMLMFLVRGSCRWRDFKPMLTFSLPLIPSALCWWVIGASDRVIISYTMGVSFNGIYALAHKFSSLYNMVSGIFQAAWLESAYESIDSDDKRAYYHKMINLTIRFYSACCLMVIIVVSFVFGIMTNESFADVYQYIPILMIASMLHSISSLYEAIYLATKKSTHVMFSVMMTAVINLSVNILLIRCVGLYAAAGSTLLAYYVLFQLRYSDMKKRLGISISGKYLSITAAVYVLSGCGYYFGNIPAKIVSAVVVAIYSYLSNKEIIHMIYRRITAKIHWNR